MPISEHFRGFAPTALFVGGIFAIASLVYYLLEDGFYIFWLILLIFTCVMTLYVWFFPDKNYNQWKDNEGLGLG